MGTVLDGFAQKEQAKIFIERILSSKPRYTRDQMSVMVQLQERYGEKELEEAISYCMERELFTAADFGDTLAFFAAREDAPAPCEEKLSLKYRTVTAENRSFNIYTSLVNGGETR